MAVGAGEAQLGRKLGADSFAEEEGDGAASLLGKRDVERARNGVLSTVQVACEENGESLSAAGWIRLAEDADDFGVGKPFRDSAAGSETIAQFCYDWKLEAWGRMGACWCHLFR